MTKLALWIEVSTKVMRENVDIIEECYRKKELDLMLQQCQAFRRHIDSFMDFLKERKAEGL